MRWSIYAATIVMFLQVGVSAAEPFDGQWKGSLLRPKPCRSAEMTLNIENGVVMGQVEFSGGITTHFRGRVTPEGVLKGARGRVEGTFSGDTAQILTHPKDVVCPAAVLRWSLQKVK